MTQACASESGMLELERQWGLRSAPAGLAGPTCGPFGCQRYLLAWHTLNEAIGLVGYRLFYR